MRRIGILVIITFIFTVNSKAQENINHWESLVNAENNWKYFPGTSEPASSWIDLGFNDNSWIESQGGFGYGDNDDGTIIGPTRSVFLRIKFTIIDLSQIKKAVLLADYDDAYVAYLNGQEISRSGISGERPAFYQVAETEHEASLYQGNYPSEINISKSAVAEKLIPGENILAIQVHNINENSSDLSSNFYLTVGLNVSNNLYQPVPAWFREPISVTSSNLPIIKIDTKGVYIPDEPKISATMGIIDNGPGSINHFHDPSTDYDGNIGIEMRGSSSQDLFPKKQYAVELWTASGLDTSASILGLPEEEDWVLNGPYSDKSLIRNFLAYNLGEALGWYAPRTRLCEVFVNEEYLGVYILTEKIKRDKNRIDISKLNPDENSGDDLTGGYIVKIDKTTGSTNGDGWHSPYPSIGKRNGVIRFLYHYPKEDEITSAQKNYIEQYITEFEDALHGPKYLDNHEGYRKYINVESFIDYSIINEISKNVDGYRLSTFLYKDKDSEDDKLYIGPLWDFNLAFGNADYCEGGETTGFEWDFNEICGGENISNPFWWKRFLRDPEFVFQYQNRWTALRSGILSNEKIMTFIDSTAAILEEPQQRNFNKWPILDEHIWPNNFIGGSYVNEVNYLKDWIDIRLRWLDTNIDRLKIITDLTDELADNSEIMIYPNPNNGTFYITVNNPEISNLKLSIQDNLGRVIHQKTITPSAADKLNLHFDHLTSGLYFMRISDYDTVLFSEKIIVD